MTQSVTGSPPKMIPLERRPLRADAAQNRARLLRVAFQTFAEFGFGAPVDEIARRAGVGAGTVYRHFPTKEQLFLAVVAERIEEVLARAEELLRTAPPEEAFFIFFTEMIDCGVEDQGFSDVVESSGIEMPDMEERFREVIGQLFTRAQEAGAVRRDLVSSDVKFLMKGCFAAQRYAEDRTRIPFLISVVLDGLRTRG